VDVRYGPPMRPPSIVFDTPPAQSPDVNAEPASDEAPETSLRPRALLVLGGHRCGTSALTRVVSLLGAALPKRLQPANEFNRLGFWESVDLMALHDDLLAAAGSSWDDFSPFPTAWYRSYSAKVFQQRILEVLVRDFPRSPLFVVKDPRISRFLPFWLSLLETFGADPAVLIMLRNPLEVAASLKQRDGIPVERAALIWLRHLLDSERHSRGYQRTVVCYEDLLDDWRSILGDAGRDLGLTWPRFDDDAAVGAVDAFLTRGDRHHRFDPDAVREERLVRWVGDTYELFRSARHDLAAIADDLDALAAQLDTAHHAFAPVLAEKQAEISTFAGEIAEVRGELATREGRIRALLSDVESREADVRRLDAELVRLGGVAGTLATREFDLQRLQAAFDELRAEKERGEAALSAREAEACGMAAELARRGDTITALHGELDALRWSWSWRVTKPLRLVRRVQRYGGRRSARRALKALRSLGTVVRGRRTIAPLFDADYYRRHNPDVARAGIPPELHFVVSGATEGRNPHPLFDVSFYLASNPDVAAAGRNPLEHYIESGGAEGRDPHPSFDSSFYLDRYADVRASGANPLLHFLTYGAAEGRKPHPLFDTQYYLEAHPEVVGTVNPLVHFVERGAVEGFSCNRDGRPLHVAQSLGAAATAAARQAIARFSSRPRISFLMPVYNTPARFLERVVASVRAQLYEDWELCVCGDGCTDPSTIDALRSLAASDRRIRMALVPVNRGIAAATNTALHDATGDYVALLDSDDELTPDALYRMVELLNEDPSIDVAYSDEDKVDPDGWLSEPFHKPDWSPHFFRGVMYVGHLLLARRSLVLDVGGFDPRFEKVQDYELMLRLSERTDRIRHLPRILYHWRKIPGSLAFGSTQKASIGDLQVAAVNSHLQRRAIAGVARPHGHLPHRATIDPLPRSDRPKISILIPSKDAPEYIGPCLDSIFTRTSYPNFEVIVVDNGTTDARALEILGRHPVERIMYDGAFNFARANNIAARAATGEHLVLLNNDTEVVTPDWLQRLLFHLELPDVACVGPLLTYPNGAVQHAGVILGLRGTADHVMRHFPSDADGYFGSLACSREVSAVTAACMVVRRSEYLAHQGLREEFRTIYQDLDFCLRLRAQGRRILFTPDVVLVHHESVSRGDAYDGFDRALILNLWGETIRAGDPYYNRNLTLARPDCSLDVGS